uniref:Androgen-induced gene 1 protein-like isoform X3 n=1 Tax=Geotrypetes seraphini TaxID=260995 RepID=A0A6P8NPL9_GEOSA|nr:androgen-induced gene 1 protein-like isoform X3 [Geotrypetes seraphini]
MARSDLWPKMAAGPCSRAVCGLHAAAFTWCALSIWQHLVIAGNGQVPSAYTYGGRWKYLTFINQVLQTILYGISLMTDLLQLFGYNKKEGFCFDLLVLRDCFFSILAFPVGTHTVVLPLLLLELTTCFHQYPGRKKGLLGLGIFCIAYLIWMLWIKYIAGIWVYPFLAKMNSVGMENLQSIRRQHEMDCNQGAYDRQIMNPDEYNIFMCIEISQQLQTAIFTSFNQQNILTDCSARKPLS